MLGDSRSSIARIINDNGADPKTDLCYEEMIEVREAFSSNLVKFLFVNDKYNYGDLFTKYFPLNSDKMKFLVKLMESGFVEIPLTAFMGRD